ncbi:EipB family protein [Reyranella sp.]|uniref:EipB family protein n=1 Tax=Reyranella sp. TaxID=1929291 RepID=UPI0037840C60
MLRLVNTLGAAGLTLLAAICPGAADAQVQPHRAEYALRLGVAANAARIGTAINDLSQDCAGWRLKRDIRSDIALTTSWRINLSSKLDAEESRAVLRYNTVQIQNGGQREMKGRVQKRSGETRAEIVLGEGSPQQLVLPPPTMLPVAALDYLIDRLRAKAASFPALMFDGEVISDAFLVDVTEQDRASLRRARPGDRMSVPHGQSWPVFLSFTRARQQDQRPLFTVQALVYDNGVVDRLTVETGLVSVTADLQSLDMRPAPVCPRS